jgi:hypothetical protein
MGLLGDVRMGSLSHFVLLLHVKRLLRDGNVRGLDRRAEQQERFGVGDGGLVHLGILRRLERLRHDRADRGGRGKQGWRLVLEV